MLHSYKLTDLSYTSNIFLQCLQPLLNKTDKLNLCGSDDEHSNTLCAITVFKQVKTTGGRDLINFKKHIFR